MSLVRQGRSFVVVGALQWLLDWAVMVGVSHAGAPVEAANVAGRISGAMLGFWLNGRWTFAREDTRLGRRQLGRFVLMWCASTTLSTLAVGQVDDVFGLQWAWLAKPAIEATLGLLGFVLARHWVYRP